MTPQTPDLVINDTGELIVISSGVVRTETVRVYAPIWHSSNLFHVNFPLNKQKHILSYLQTLINHKH